MSTYRIVRFYKDPDIPREVVARGLTLEQAQAHCNDPETSSSTATGEHAKERTARKGAWFDGYEDEDRDEEADRRRGEEMLAAAMRALALTEQRPR